MLPSGTLPTVIPARTSIRDGCISPSNPASAGYIVIGPKLEMLGRIHRRFPVTFYDLVVGAVNRWLRTYDYQGCIGASGDVARMGRRRGRRGPVRDPGRRELHSGRDERRAFEASALSGLISQVQDDGLRSVIEAALTLEGISQRLQCPEISEETRDAFMDSNPPLAALLVSFKRNDSVAGVFEEEGQAMLEACPEPSFIVVIDPGNAETVRRAFDALAVLCETMAGASRLAALLPGNGEEG